MKAYCKDCKYYASNVFIKMDKYLECIYPDNIKIHDTVYARETMILKHEYEINKDNNCKWFAPKWYKIYKYKL